MFEEVRQRVAGVPPVEATDQPEGHRRMRRETPKTNKTVTDFNDVGRPTTRKAGWGTSHTE
ncbi:MAG: hypothetical protein KME49_17955 [Brasilonema octagenarum HA4186-MV1]|nr:hypothetical protein [Brasilonema octagenarum HA4186-MV1]